MPKSNKTLKQAAAVDPQSTPYIASSASMGGSPDIKVKPATKIDTVIAMLCSPDGATVQDLMEATGWQAHSVRGALAGTIKKKLGHALTSEKSERGRVYLIIGPVEPDVPSATPIPGDADDVPAYAGEAA